MLLGNRDAASLVTASRLVLQIENQKWRGTQLTGEYNGKDYTACLTVGNPDLLNGSGVCVCVCVREYTGKDYTACLTAGNPDLLNGSGLCACVCVWNREWWRRGGRGMTAGRRREALRVCGRRCVLWWVEQGCVQEREEWVRETRWGCERQTAWVGARRMSRERGEELRLEESEDVGWG